MSVAPGRLEGITADQMPSGKFKTLRGVMDFRPNDIAEDIRLAPAGGAGTGAAEEAERQKRFTPVVPLDRQLAPDLLDILRLEAHEATLPTIRSQEQPFPHRFGVQVCEGRRDNFSFFPAFLCS